MVRVIAVRIGESQDIFNQFLSKGKWSSPESLNSIVRQNFLIGYNVFIIFCNISDCPLYITKITGVRQRYNIADADFPLEHPLGKFQTFIEFNPTQVINVNQIHTFNKVKEHIKYIAGHEVLIDNKIIEPLISYYNGFFHGFSHATANIETVKEDVPVMQGNTTYINKSEYDKLYKIWT